jgi:predicted Zn-dependent peptidase
VYKDQIAVQAAGSGDFSEDPNLFWAYAIMNPGHTPEDGEKAIVTILDGLKTQPVGANELQKAKNQEISGFILGRDTDENKAIALASATLIGKNPDLVNTELDRYLKVTPEDIERVAKEYFVSQRATILTIKPAAPAQ